MKKSNFLLIVLMLSLSFLFAENGLDKKAKNSSSNTATFTVLSSPDLELLSNAWIDQYKIINPEADIKVNNIKNKNFEKELNDGKSVALVTSKYADNINRDKYKVLVVGRDVIVPVINAENPIKDILYSNGVSADNFSRLFDNSENPNWKTLFGVDNDCAINYYYSGDESVNKPVIEFLGKDNNQINGVKFKNTNEVVDAVRNDINGLAFVRITDVIDNESNDLLSNIMLLPIDKNENGVMDSFDQIYGNLNTFLRGVWIGKYPRELVTNIYSVSSATTDNKNSDAFISWVLTDGQSNLNSLGYCKLVIGERQSRLDKLLYENPIPEKTEGGHAGLKILLIAMVILILVLLNIETSRIYKKYRRRNFTPGIRKDVAVINENSFQVPQGLFFDKSHTWAFMERDGRVKIGMNDFLPRITGNLTGVILKNPGDKIKKGEVVISLIQKGKKLDIKAPVSGTIKELNKNLQSDASLINFSPYNDAWIYLIEPTNWLREIQFMLMAEKFKTWLRSEFTRLKDFIAIIQKDTSTKAQIIFQEGGELKSGLLEDLGPEVWEDFQSFFIETSA